jgi:sugar lactone lactonase YvrE
MRKLVFAVTVLTALPVWGASYYTTRLEDDSAVYMAPGDGIADASDAVQNAIDTVQQKTRQGIVFIPEGRYRLTRTVYVWPGIRLIGYGAKRPVFVLGENTPGFQQGPSYMLFFTGGRHQKDGTPRDANPGTFYSAISNIDIEIRDGNPGAVGLRARYAQHCFIAHMDLRIGSGLAGIHDGGNAVEDVHFHGGRYGIMTKKPSPGWQFTLVDTSFEGQREAAIKCHEAGLTLIRPYFKNVPTAISIDPGYAEELWVKDGRMEDVSGPAVVISNEQNARTEINLENVVCRRVPVFASFRESGRHVAGAGEIYAVKTFSHGLHYADIGAPAEVKSTRELTPLAALPEPAPSDLPDLPARESWVNVRSLGARGDGVADDTAALRAAIASHRALYFPSGKYRVTDTIALAPDTVLIGLHPSTTQIDLVDGTPAFQGVGNPKAVVEAPAGGTNIMIGLGVYTNGLNPRAVAVKWMAGEHSLINDVRFLGGHGTNRIDGSGEQVYNNTHTADPNLERRWDGQYPSLWVTNGGGGTFFDIWTPSTFAQAGMVVSDTASAGRVYQMSSEHHVRNEVRLHNVSNWSLYALQTEEERGEGGFALPLEISNSSNITVANVHIYRVVSSFQPFPYAIKVVNSSNIRLRNIHCYSDSKVSFDSAVYDQTHNVEVRQREFAWMTISGRAPQARPRGASPVLAAGAKVEKLAGGFYNISGAAVDPSGDLYFVDAKWQRIYRWSAAQWQLSLVRDNPLDPVQLLFDKAGNLIVISSAGKGTVYAFKPGSRGDEITLLKAEPAAPRPGLTAVLPVDHWRLENDFVDKVPVRRPYQFVSPDGTTFVPAGDDFIEGRDYYGAKLHDVLRAFGMAPAAAGKRFYVSEESYMRTWSASVDDYGTLTDVKLFAEQGGEGLAVDAAGNVYIAAGQVFVYSPSGKLIDTIDVPERPVGLAFGGKERKTLFIAARSSLYAVRTR